MTASPSMNILLVGHRGTGKSSIGPLLATQMGLAFADLDDLIERSTGTSCAELVASDEPGFRKLEVETLKVALAGGPRVIAAGAGLHPIPDDALVVWLYREGWERTAETERERLRPDLSWDEELAWMFATREPRWVDAAHLHYRISTTRTPETAAEELAELIGWFEPNDNSLRRSAWVVVAEPHQLPRAEADVRRFGLAGVEVRSDRFGTWPELSVPTIASLRTANADWVAQSAGASRFDIDLEFFDTAERAGLFELSPRPLILSTHPARLEPDDVSALARIARRIQEQHPEWLGELSLKYAPQIDDPDHIGMGRAMVGPLRRAGIPVTFIPQGSKWAWTRPILAAENVTNYVATGMRAERAGLPVEASLTPMDLQDWLPHFTGAPPEVFDLLIGDPVDQSRGDVWHRRAALAADERTGYVKAQVDDSEFDGMLAAFAQLGVRGVSVTSPLKRRISFVCPDDASFGPLLPPEEAARAASRGMPVRTGNTLVHTEQGWLATDTDEAGMAACLEVIEATGAGPGTIAIIGRGGVTPAILRAIDASDWFVVLHVGARDGWPENRPGFVTLIVNAAGPGPDVSTNAPRCKVWLDLHYAHVAAVDGPRLHLNGDCFFEAQARAQRSFWASRTGR